MLQRTIQTVPAMARWWQEILPGPEREPEWATPNQVVATRPACRLRDFGGGPPGGGPPLLIVAPEVNGSNLADYGPDQSLVQVARRAGFGRVCLLQWLQIGAETADRRVEDSIDDIGWAIDQLGGRVHLMGICQGGWEAAVVVALDPRRAASLTLAGAAIDFRLGNGVITRLIDVVPQPAYEAMVASGGGVMRGSLLRAGFDSLQWFQRRVVAPLQLWNHIDDPEFSRRKDLLDRWSECRKDLPGPAYLQVVDELFRHNKLIKGEFTVGDRMVDLSRIECPVAMVGGTSDHITLPCQVFAAADHVGSTRKRCFEVSGGHIGLIVGRTAQAEAWPQIFAWLQEAITAD